MQHAQEAAPKPKAQRIRRFWLIKQRRIIERQLTQRLSKILIVVRVDRENARINLRFDLFKTGQSRRLLV